MDKTYAETQNEAPFDWNKALANPPDYRSEEHDRLAEKAESWTTCACGNQCAIIPRFGARPEDAILASLGLSFYDEVSNGEWEKSKETLQAIEARSAILIQQELAKRNSK